MFDWRVKVRKKSSAWAKHGKHKSVLMEVRAMQRKPKRMVEMYDSLVALFSGARKRRTPPT